MFDYFFKSDFTNETEVCRIIKYHISKFLAKFLNIQQPCFKILIYYTPVFKASQHKLFSWNLKKW